MSKVSKIVWLNFLALVTIVGLFGNLIKTYAVAPTISITETCVQIFEYYGINLESNTSKVLAGTVASMIFIMVVKIVLSFYKIQQKTHYINRNKINLDMSLRKLIENLGLEGKVVLIDVQEHIALVLGLVRPQIIISSGLIHDLTFRELETVLLHEKHHLKNFHSSYIFVSEIVKSMLFFLPILSDLSNYLRESIEHDADKYAIKYQKNVVYLKSALKKVKSSDLSFIPTFSSIKRENLTNTPHIKIRYINATVTLITSLALASLYINKPAVSVQYTGDMCISNECIERCLSTQQ